MLERKELLKTGKAKSLYHTDDPSKLIMEYKDDTSAFDGKKIEQIAGREQLIIGSIVILWNI